MLAGEGSKTDELDPHKCSRDRDLAWTKLSGVFAGIPLLLTPLGPELPVLLVCTLPEGETLFS